MSCNDVIWHDPKHDSLQRKGTLRCLWNRVKANIEAKEKIHQQHEINNKTCDEAKQFIHDRKKNFQGISIKILKIIGRLINISSCDAEEWIRMMM
jgi:predicted metal-dependent RNase